MSCTKSSIATGCAAFACGHCCPLPDGAGRLQGALQRGGTLYVPWGYVGGVQCDPIEKKPFFHAYPGALAYSFGMLGCDLHCGYCQNWVTSQALRDPAAVAPPLDATPEALVRDALRLRRAGDGQHLQRAADHQRVGGRDLQGSEGARASSTGFVSNGNGTPQVLEYLRPWVDLYKVDLKSFDDRHYRQLGGRLAADPRHDPPAARDGLLGRDRHAADPRLQRLARRARSG